MLNFLKTIFKSGIAKAVIVILVLSGGYYGYKTFFVAKPVTRYITTNVSKGTLIVSVSGSGQVSSTDQIEIKPKVSGDVKYIAVIDGQEVKAGSVVAQIDSTDAEKTVRDAEKAVRDAEVSLESTKLSLEKSNLQYSQQARGDTLDKDYRDGMDILSKLYSEFSTTLENIKNIYFSVDLSTRNQRSCNIDYYDFTDCNITYYSNQNKQFSSVPVQILGLYQKISELYSQNIVDYQTAKIDGDNNARSKAIKEGHDLVVKTVEMIKISRDVIQSLQDAIIKSGGTNDHQSIIDGHAKDLADYSTTMTSYETDLLGVINSTNSYFDSIASQPIDLKSQELSITQKENAILDAKDKLADVKGKLADYIVRAPFAGIITKVNIKATDTISSSTSIAILVTKQQVAEISLNEVDVAAIKLKQKVTLTFDAIPDFSIAGEVAQIDSIGTVSQGVVTYNVKISFDTQDSRVKSGMSVSASIITNVKQDVLVVPNSAVKSQNGSSYVEMFDALLPAPTDGLMGSISTIPPNKINVMTGLSNDSETEIVSGIKEGDEIVTRTILPTSTKTPTTSSLLGGSGGGNRGGGIGQ